MLALLSLQVATAAPTPPTRLIAALVINEQAKADIFAVLTGQDLWLPVASLTGAGLVGFAGDRRDFFGEPHVSLTSLAPALTYTLDRNALVIRLTAAATLFQPTIVTLQAARPSDLEYLRAPGLFFNYGATVQQDAKPALAAEAGLSIGGVLLSSSVTRTGDQRFLPGLTSLTIDDRSRMRRVIIGDTFASPSLLGSSALVAGISIRSQFSLDPYQVPFPLPSVQGVVTTPATAEVYVNDTLVGQQALAPGAFQLQRLPATTGLGDVHVVVRDLLGREQTFGGPYYLTSSVLRPGVAEYDYLVGFARTDDLNRGPTYRTLTASASHRIGVTPWLTLGAAAEGSPHVVDVGPTVNMRIWRLGEIDGAASVSRSAQQTGGAVSGSYVIVAHPFSATLSGTHIAATYSSLSLGVNDPRQINRFNASISVTLGRLASLSLRRSYDAGLLPTAPDPRTQEQYVPPGGVTALQSVSVFESPPQLRDSAILALRVGARARLAVTVTHVAHADAPLPSSWEGSGSLSVVLGSRAVATVTHSRADRSESTSVDLQRSLPLGTGVGYRFLGDTANTGSWNGLLQAQGPYGRVNLRETALGGQQNASVDLSGGVVLTGGEVNLTRRVDDGYALVRVPAGPGIRVYLNDQVVGRTDRRGTALVPNLLSYLGNPIRIADEDVPLDFELGRTQALVAPPWRGPAIVTFAAAPLHGLTGRLVLVRAGRDLVPAFGLLVVTTDVMDVVSPVGEHGEFFVDRLAPGAHEGRLEFEGDTCAFTLQVPIVTTIITDIGVVTCRAETDRP